MQHDLLKVRVVLVQPSCLVFVVQIGQYEKVGLWHAQMVSTSTQPIFHDRADFLLYDEKVFHDRYVLERHSAFYDFFNAHAVFRARLREVY